MHRLTGTAPKGKAWRSMIAAGVAVLLGAAPGHATQAPNEPTDNAQVLPLLVYRDAPNAAVGVPYAAGFIDYLRLVNRRDGGANGVRLLWEACETGLDNDRGIACYEALKHSGPSGAAVVIPASSGIAVALTRRARADRIPLLSIGYGRTASADGRVFPYLFPLPVTYGSLASALVRYVGEQAGGLDRLQGREIALVFHDSAYGREPIPVLRRLAKRYGFSLHPYAVPHPGEHQRLIWSRIGWQLRPDWVFLWGWGVMTATALREAGAAGYPVERIVGTWWAGSEPVVAPAGAAAVGFHSAALHAPGRDFPAHAAILAELYGDGEPGREQVGTVLYNRGLMNAAVVVEAIRTGQARFGARPLNGEEMRWGLENLEINAARLETLGLAGFMPPLKLSCVDHEGQHPVRIQEWDGAAWHIVSDWVAPIGDVVRPLIETAAADYARARDIMPRDCEVDGAAPQGG
jgi:branched-chain amino acid transport system substrate-binding protein